MTSNVNLHTEKFLVTFLLSGWLTAHKAFIKSCEIGPMSYLKGNDILLLFAVLFLWLNLENHLHSQNALIVSEYKIIIF